MSYQSKRQQLINAIAGSFSNSLPNNLPTSIREEIVANNLVIGEEIADSILTLFHSIVITPGLLQQIMSGEIPTITLASLIN
jgi:hypothetical protein